MHDWSRDAMADEPKKTDKTAAERMRRYRRHKAGDHSLCFEGKCPAVTLASDPKKVTSGVTAERHAGVDTLGAPGAKLWADLTKDEEPAPLQAALMLEACRIVDRLDKLDRQLRGEDWLRFKTNPESDFVTVYVDKVLAEAREQAVALRGIVAELLKSQARKDTDTSETGGKTSVLADLSARIAARRPPATA